MHDVSFNELCLIQNSAEKTENSLESVMFSLLHKKGVFKLVDSSVSSKGNRKHSGKNPENLKNEK